MTDLLRRAYDPADFRARGHALIDRLADYLEGVEELPANPYAEPEEMLARYRQLLDDSAPPAEVFERVIADSVHLHHPRYVGHQIVPPAPLSALADVAGSLLNTGMAIFEMGRPGAAMEKVVIERFAQLLELAPTAGGFLTSGGTLANLTALLAARAARWPDGEDVWARGSHGRRPCVLVNEQAHYCIDRAVRIMGWGAEGIVHVPHDAELRMRTELLDGILADAVARGLTPIALIGSACTTSTGSYDDLTALADAAQRHGLWLHVDGAHGAPIRLDPRRRERVAGLERAHSLTMDFHKMLLAPAITTGLFFRESRDAYRTFAQRADYLLNFSSGEEDWYNVARRSFECTKRLLSLRIYTLLTTYGDQLFVDYVCRVGDLGELLAGLVREQPDFELALWPAVNIVCFRYRPAARTHGAEEIDALNEMIREALIREGDYYPVTTRVHGRVYLRCTLTNAFTEEEDLRGLLARLRASGEALVNFRAGLPG